MPPAAPPRPSGPRHRARRLRRLAVTWTVVAFAVVWGVIYAQMRAGDDPALGTGTAAALTTGAAGAGDDGAAVVTTDAGTETGGDTSAFAESSGTDTSAMTTSQS